MDRCGLDRATPGRAGLQGRKRGGKPGDLPHAKRGRVCGHVWSDAAVADEYVVGRGDTEGASGRGGEGVAEETSRGEAWGPGVGYQLVGDQCDCAGREVIALGSEMCYH